MMGCVLWKVLGWGYRDCVGMRGMRPRFYSSAFRALSGLRWYAGFPYGKPSTTPRSYCADAAPAPPLSFSCVKKKDGGERKSLGGTIRRREAHSLPRGNPCVAAGFGPLQEK